MTVLQENPVHGRQFASYGATGRRTAARLARRAIRAGRCKQRPGAEVFSAKGMSLRIEPGGSEAP